MDLVIIGYLLHDVLDVDGIVKHCLGGPAAYTSLAAARLGLKTGIVSKVGPDFKYLGELSGIDLRGLSRQDKTTVFFNSYYQGERTQRVANLGNQIQPKDIPEGYLEARAIHLGPVFKEIAFETMRFLRENTKALITLDPQGFLRREKNGAVLLKEMDYSLLDFVDVVKVSEKEFPEENIEDLIAKCKTVIVTRGNRGSTIFFDGKTAEIPFFKTIVVDETGAADVYMAGFIKKFLETGDTEKSALFGSAAASFAVENFGLNGIRGEKEINERIKASFSN